MKQTTSHEAILGLAVHSYSVEQRQSNVGAFEIGACKKRLGQRFDTRICL